MHGLVFELGQPSIVRTHNSVHRAMKARSNCSQKSQPFGRSHSTAIGWVWAIGENGKIPDCISRPAAAAAARNRYSRTAGSGWL